MNPTTTNSRNAAHLGEISPKLRGGEDGGARGGLGDHSKARRDVEARARGACEALGGNGDGASA